MEDERRRSKRARIRSFALGGVVGAVGTIATARRLRRPSLRPADAPAGLAAFEDAPCFLELVEREAQVLRDARRYREGGEIDTGRSNSE
jgi:hypothetical protein